MRQWRQQLSPEQQSGAALDLASQCSALPQWTAAQHIGLYLPADGEVSTAVLADRVREVGKTTYLPVVQDNLLLFAEWRAAVPLVTNRYGIGEPDDSLHRKDAGELDILCLPVVAWDRSGARLGMGGGYYDRTLAQTQRPLLVGLAHAGQEVAELPRDDWDINLDWIVTDAECYRCGTSGD
ncbi:MAG: 5-formyltetrahydrofolate cyclo-ligase [Halioglobus sp.]|nr:5-formyltetrahydrofolate cyclo-ligase [Halioglobus sp.]